MSGLSDSFGPEWAWGSEYPSAQVIPHFMKGCHMDSKVKIGLSVLVYYILT